MHLCVACASRDSQLEGNLSYGHQGKYFESAEECEHLIAYEEGDFTNLSFSVGIGKSYPFFFA